MGARVFPLAASGSSRRHWRLNLTTDEAQQTGERRMTTTSDDEFSSENYVTKSFTAAPTTPPTSVEADQAGTDQTETVILGTVSGEFHRGTEMAAIAESESATTVDADAD